MILNATLLAYIDAACAFYRRALGTEASGYGIGPAAAAWGSAGQILAMETALLADTDLDSIEAMVGAVRQLKSSVSGRTYASSVLSPLMAALGAHIARAGLPSIGTLDAYLTYLNTGDATKWQALAPPAWRDIVQLAPAATNVYFEVLQGSDYANALGKFIVGGAFTAGHQIDSALYAGGFPQVRASGVTGSGVVTVTGYAMDPATKSVATGRTWTATVSANGVVALAPGGGSPAATDSLILRATGVSAAVGLSAATLYVEAARPAGRPLIP